MHPIRDRYEGVAITTRRTETGVPAPHLHRLDDNGMSFPSEAEYKVDGNRDYSSFHPDFENETAH